jgi:hypothetical protein
MFRTDDNWEDKPWGQFAGQLYKEPGTRGYLMVEVTSGLRYHIDAKPVPLSGETPRYASLIFNHLADVLRVIQNKNFIDLRISIQSAFDESHDYVISAVVEIIEATDALGNQVFLSKCIDNRTYTSPLQIKDEKTLRAKRAVWSRHGMPKRSNRK